MKTETAIELLKEVIGQDKSFPLAKLVNLLQFVYEKGWEEGISEYMEDCDPTEYQEWRGSR